MTDRSPSSNESEPKIAGVILCGGRSSRMGTPKPWLRLGSQTLLDRVARTLGQVVDPLVLVAAPATRLPPIEPKTTILRDNEEFPGPLAGTALGLRFLRDQTEAEFAYVSGCDVPFLRPEWVTHLVRLIDPDADAIVPHDEHHHHSLAAIYRVDLCDTMQQLVQENRRGFGALWDHCRPRFVPVASLQKVDPELDSLRNLNTPEDYEVAKEREPDGFGR